MVFPLKNILRFSVFVFGIFIATVKPDEDPDSSKILSCELSLAQLLLLPPDSMQVQALKRELFRYLEEKLEEDEQTKHSLNALIHDNNIPYVFKRNLEALARAGYLKTQSDTDPDEMKRSIANLAKNGQLPTFQKPDAAKRSLESLARNGYTQGKRSDIDNLLRDLYYEAEKRHIGALARGFNFPVTGKRFMNDFEPHYENKRNIASLVRGNNLPTGKRYPFDEFKRNVASIARNMGGKRAVPSAALLRQDNYQPSTKHYDEDGNETEKNENENENDDEKRNLAALKAQMKSKYKRAASKEDATASRNKRQADYWEPNEEFPVPVYQNNNVYDYEELIHELTGEYPNTEKRFLGRIPQMGRPKTTPRSQKNR